MVNIKVKNQDGITYTIYNNVNSVFVPSSDDTKIAFYGEDGTSIQTYTWETENP